jgi:hypothetical protein
MNAAASGAKRYSCFINSKPPSFLPSLLHKLFVNGGVSSIASPTRRVGEPVNATDFKVSRYATIKLTLMGQRPGNRNQDESGP